MAHFNFRLFLRPTLVGKVIIDRLTADGADRQAEARRWIELGYMCEQAGFRLDGNTLFQAGRPAAAEASTAAQVPVHTMPAAAVVAYQVTEAIAQAATQRAGALASGSQAPASGAAEPQAPSPSAPVGAEPSARAPNAAGSTSSLPAPPVPFDSELDDNLRNLAH